MKRFYCSTLQVSIELFGGDFRQIHEEFAAWSPKQFFFLSIHGFLLRYKLPKDLVAKKASQITKAYFTLCMTSTFPSFGAFLLKTIANISV